MNVHAPKYRRLLRETATLIALRDDPGRAFSLLRRRAPRLLPHVRFEVLLLDEEEGALSVPVISQGGRSEEGPMIRLAPGAEGLPAYLRLAEPRILPVTGLGEKARAAALRRLGIRRVLVLPLVYREERLGALCFGAADRATLDEGLRLFAGELAGLLSAVIGRERTARQLQESRKRLAEKARRIRLVHQIATAVNGSLVLDRIFRAIVREARRLVEFDRAALAVVERDGRMLRIHAVSAREGSLRVEKPARIGIEESLSGHVIRSRRARSVPDISQSRDRHRAEEKLYRRGLLSYVAFPLIVRDRAVGAFNLASREAGHFTETDREILESVADHLAVAVENARLLESAQDRSRELSALYEVAKTLLSVVDLDELLREVLRIVHDTFEFDNCAVLLPDEKGQTLYVRAARGYREEAIEGFRVRIGEEGVTGRVAHKGEAIYVPDVRKDPRYLRGIERGRSELALPLVVGGEVIGVLDIESPRVDAFSEPDINGLSLFASQVALALDRARLFAKVQEQARTDGLTGLLNQRYFHHTLSREVDRARRSGQPFSLVLIDMDNLKEINDLCGHLAGNLAITQVAEILREHCREIDHAARYGGDEFAVILPGSDLPEAVAVAERLRVRISEIRIEGAASVSASCGVATYPRSTDSETMLVVLADRAMYEAKAAGKNRTASANPISK